MRTSPLLFSILPMLATLLAIPASLAADQAAQEFWNGPWFFCEFSGRTSPPEDGCAMVDDDGFLFSSGKATYIKVMDSPETDSCHKQRHGQCFRPDEPRISVSEGRSGRAEFTMDTLGIRFLGCTQTYHVSDMGAFLEARPDDERCIWAGERRFYLRRYEGEIRTVE